MLIKNHSHINRQQTIELAIISLTYLVAHWMMNVITGTFHDDWLSLFHDVETKNLEGIESGRPYYSALIELVWGCPGYSYRVLAFFTYWLAYVLMYLTLRSANSDQKMPVVVTVLCITTPINDAKILLANYPYAFAYFLFWGGCYLLLSRIHECMNSFRSRIAPCILFILSFTLNSNLVVYGALLLFVLIKHGHKGLLRMPELVLLPVAFFVLNKMFFPVYGAYSDYNQVTMSGLVVTVKNLPSSLFGTIINVLAAISCKPHLLGVVVASVALGIYLYRSKVLFNPSDSDEDSHQLLGVGLGLTILVLGILPYSLVRGGGSNRSLWCSRS